MGQLADDLEDDLVSIVGPAHVLTDAELMRSYEVDWTARFVGHARAVVRPASVEEVSHVVACCARHECPVVPQGGNTGLVGGSVPLAGEVVLSLRRLNQLLPVEPGPAQVTAGAGVSLATLQQHADAAGLAFGVDLAARDQATVGGMVATNAGGVRVLRYGPMRAQLAGIEAVLADGTVVRRLGGLVKDNTGYDLAGLLAGSEGTLAVVTAARLHLVPRLERRVVALLALDSMAAALEALVAVRDQVPSLEAAEAFFSDGLALVCRVRRLPAPFPAAHPLYLLLECAAHHDPTEELGRAVSSLAGLVADVAVATDAPARARLWQLREAHTEAVATLGVPHKLDISLPLSSMEGFVNRVREVVADVAPGARVVLFGHLGDGNLHVNVVGATGEPGTWEVDDAVLGLVAELGGSISAEHGIGVAKRPWLHLNRSPAELEVFRAIKTALDPRRILNPNALLPPG